MNLLDELRSIRHLLDLIPSDNVPKNQATNFNIAKNRLMKVISEGERIEKAKMVKLPPAQPERIEGDNQSMAIHVPYPKQDDGCEVCQ